MNRFWFFKRNSCAVAWIAMNKFYIGRNNLLAYLCPTLRSSFNLRKSTFRVLNFSQKPNPKHLLNYSSSIEELNPWWITGFIDGEGSFIVFIIENKKLKVGWQVEPVLSIRINEKDLAILKKIKNFFCVGKIFYRKKKQNLICLESAH